ncbi:MAG: hypothetical protein ACRDO1_15630 [Nocardioidaceae bacterium]
MRLHVDRPCQVYRQTDGHWGWRCSLCPLPLCRITRTVDAWSSAYVEAANHLRTDHVSPPEPAVGWGLAA